MWRTRMTRALFLGLLISVAPAVLRAEADALTQEQVLRGQVVDPAFYLTRTPKPADTLEPMTPNNRPALAFLDGETDRVYLFLFLPGPEGEELNQQAQGYLNCKVMVTGHIVERGGLPGLLPTRIEPGDALSPEPGYLLQ